LRSPYRSTMDPLEKCLQTLRPLIAAGDINGIGLAERAIDQFVNSHKNPYLRRFEAQGQTGALNVLDQELTAIWRTLTPGRSLDFITTASDYVDRKVRELRDASPLDRKGATHA
jgi:hypothetical protein